jgi:hypothetical protein
MAGAATPERLQATLSETLAAFNLQSSLTTAQIWTDAFCRRGAACRREPVCRRGGMHGMRGMRPLVFSAGVFLIRVL